MTDLLRDLRPLAEAARVALETAPPREPGQYTAAVLVLSGTLYAHCDAIIAALEEAERLREKSEQLILVAGHYLAMEALPAEAANNPDRFLMLTQQVVNARHALRAALRGSGE